jgi:hypothetical protein
LYVTPGRIETRQTSFTSVRPWTVERTPDRASCRPAARLSAASLSGDVADHDQVRAAAAYREPQRRPALAVRLRATDAPDPRADALEHDDGGVQLALSGQPQQHASFAPARHPVPDRAAPDPAAGIGLVARGTERRAADSPGQLQQRRAAAVVVRRR